MISPTSRLTGLAALALTLAAPMGAVVLPAPAALAQAARASRDPQAETFVQNEASQVLSILNDKSLSLEAKKRQFRAMVDQVADVPRITNFVLGKYARTLTPQQKQAFAETFREYANSVYESRLGDYHGEGLKVTGSVERAPGDVVVTSQVVGGQVKQPTPVNWRVLKGPDGRWKAVDVQVGGVWLAFTQQQDFNSTLDNAHGDINVLIAQLRSQMNKNEAGRR